MRERDAFGLAFRAGSEKQNGRFARVGIRFESAHPWPPRKHQRAQFVAHRKHAARVFEREQANARAFELRLRRFEPRGLQKSARAPNDADSGGAASRKQMRLAGREIEHHGRFAGQRHGEKRNHAGDRSRQQNADVVAFAVAGDGGQGGNGAQQTARRHFALAVGQNDFAEAVFARRRDERLRQGLSGVGGGERGFFDFVRERAGEFRAPVFRLAGGERGAKRCAERDRNRRKQSFAAERAEARVFAAADVRGDDRRATAFFPHRRRAVVKFHQNPGATNPPFGKNRHFAAASQLFAQRAQRERIVRRQRDHPPHRQKRAHPPFAKISRIEREQCFRGQAASEQRAVQQRDMIGDDKTRPRRADCRNRARASGTSAARAKPKRFSTFRGGF